MGHELGPLEPKPRPLEPKAAEMTLAGAVVTLLAGRQGPETDGEANGGTNLGASAEVLVKPSMTAGARLGAAAPGREGQISGSTAPQAGRPGLQGQLAFPEACHAQVLDRYLTETQEGA